MFVHLTHKHRDPETFAAGLSRKELAPALWQMSMLSIMLRAVTADIY
jgi:hypothetical protein